MGRRNALGADKNPGCCVCGRNLSLSPGHSHSAIATHCRSSAFLIWDKVLGSVGGRGGGRVCHVNCFLGEMVGHGSMVTVGNEGHRNFLPLNFPMCFLSLLRAPRNCNFSFFFLDWQKIWWALPCDCASEGSENGLIKSRVWIYLLQRKQVKRTEVIS